MVLLKTRKDVKLTTLGGRLFQATATRSLKTFLRALIEPISSLVALDVWRFMYELRIGFFPAGLETWRLRFNEQYMCIVWDCFLPRYAMRKRGLCCGPVSVCLSVRLSRCCIVSRRLKISSNFFLGPVDNLVFWSPRRYPIPRETPSAGTQNTRGAKILRFSTEIAVYLANGTR